MKAAIIRKYGKPEVLQIEEVAQVYPQKNEVKIQVHASSVNPIDFKVRSGNIAFLSGWKYPKILGSDFSGVITECGQDVTDYKQGDEVFGFTNAATKGGAYGEYLCCDTGIIAKKPASLSFLEAGATPLTALTAFQGLYQQGRMRSGMRILVTGATGGVGHFAVQIAKAAQCHVTGVCHSLNEELAYKFGCDDVLPYDQDTFRQNKQQYDLVFDAVGKYGYFTFRANLTKHGSYVTTIPYLTTMLLQMATYLSHGHKVRFFLANSNTTDLNKLSDLVNQGLLRPFIENVFSIEDIDSVHALSETQKVRGKIGVKSYAFHSEDEA